MRGQFKGRALGLGSRKPPLAPEPGRSLLSCQRGETA